MTGAGRAAEALGLVAPFSLWAAGFVALYGGHGLACGIGVEPSAWASATRIALGAVLVLFLAAHVWLVWWFRRRWRAAEGPHVGFVRLASYVLALAALPTTLWTGFPVLVLEICA